MKLRSKKRRKTLYQPNSVHPTNDDDQNALTELVAQRLGGDIELFLGCTDLPSLDLFSKSDPMCVLFVRQFGQWRELGRTEAVKNCLNPKFFETFIMDYDPEESQHLLFSVYDVDSMSSDLSNHDHVGSVELSLADLLRPEHVITTTTHILRTPGTSAGRGYLHITTEPVRRSKKKVLLHLGASKLQNLGAFSRKCTYMELSRSLSATNFHPVFRSEASFGTKSPRWRPVELNIQRLCNGDVNREVKVTCWQDHRARENSIVGEVFTTLLDLENCRKSKLKEIALLSPTKKKDKVSKEVGTIKLLQYRLETDYSLLDFVKGGCDIKFMLGIDFTSSNGKASDPLSLHYLEGDTDNEYIEAIKTVGSLLSHYDVTQQFSVYGFGAKLANDQKAQHCFPLSDSPIQGIQGILHTYRSIVPELVFSGPSYLSHVINTAVQRVSSQRAQQEEESYNVLMLLTDGIVNDVDQALEGIKRSSVLPLSIVFVVVGPAGSTVLEQIESINALMAKGNYRHNIHTLTLRSQRYATGHNATLAQECFAEVSRQIVEYMKLHNIHPHNFAQSTDALNTLAQEPPERGLYRKHKASMHSNRSSVYSLHKSYSVDALHTSGWKRDSRRETRTSTSELHFSLPMTQLNKASSGPCCPTCGSSISLFME